jgi:hypothetical protein
MPVGVCPGFVAAPMQIVVCGAYMFACTVELHLLLWYRLTPASAGAIHPWVAVPGEAGSKGRLKAVG